MADPEIWKALIETGNPYAQQERQQKGLMGMMELEEKRRAMADEQRLRELYAGGREPSQREVMAANPKLGIELQKAGNQAYLQQLQAEKLQREKLEADAKTYAQYVGPVADTYYDDLSRGMPEEQAMQKFRSGIGAAQSELHQKHGIMPQADFTQFNPEHILQRTTGLGVPSRHYAQQEEMQKRMMPPSMSSEQYFGAYHPTPEGYVIRTPGIGGQMPQRQAPAQIPSRQPMGQEDVTEQQLMSYIDSLPEGPEKQRLQGVITQGKSMAPGSTSAVEISPEELAKIRTFREGEKAKTVETAKLEANKEQTIKQREEILSSIPARDEIEKLIDKSISSGVEQQLKGKLGPAVGMGSEALSATKQLDVIAPQLKSITKSLAGAGAISDFEQKMMADAAGAIADPNVPADARKAAFRTFMDIMDKADKTAKPASSGLQIGHEESGYVYKGGDPGKQSSWEKK